MSAARRVATWSLGALALGAAWWLGQEGARLGDRPDALAPPEAAPAIAPQPATPAGASELARPLADAQATPMPPADALFVDAWPALLARAEAGDRVASCRLTLSALRCAADDNAPDPAETPALHGTEALPASAQDAIVDLMANALEGAVRDRAHCAGVDAALVQSLPALVYRAARGSDDPHALAAFADGTLAGRHLLFDDQGRRLHREHGAWAIDRLIALGEGHGLFLLMVGSGDVRFAPIHSVVTQDDDLGTAAAEAIRALGGNPDRSPRYERLDAAARARVDLQIDALRQRFGRERPAWHGDEPFPQMLNISSHSLPPEHLEAYCRVAMAQRTP